MSRPDIKDVMLEMTMALATRASCRKLKVGCVITDEEYRVLACGYNGPPRDWPHCSDMKHCVGDLWDACFATHAESNALISYMGDRSRVRFCFTNYSPCLACCKQLVQTGCQEIIFCSPSPEHDMARDFWQYGKRQWTQHVVAAVRSA